jgi:hypothetical protein
MSKMNKTPREQYAERFGDKAAGRVDQLMLQAVCAAGLEQLVGGLKDEDMHRQIGVTVIMFDFGPPGGAMAYASSANREDFLRLLDELRGKLAATMPDTPRGD